jgi:DNA polymerase III alpha subunit
MKTIDEYGRVSVDMDSLLEILYNGSEINSVHVNPCDELNMFNDLCRKTGKESFILSSLPPVNCTPQEEHDRRAATWFIPNGSENVDVRQLILSRCDTDIEKDRVNLEMDMFEDREMIQNLRLMLGLVNHFRKTGVIWGVGRGSSVSSYVLFKIGIHKIDSIKYGLDIKEFLK